MKTYFAIIFIAINALGACGNAQIHAQNSAPISSICKSSKELINTDLFGAWTLQLQTAAGAISTRLTMERNPEFAESLAGHFFNIAKRHDVFGDIEDGALEFEESNNGKDIIALWRGRVTDGSCGQAITGTRRLVNTTIEQNFVLRRAGW
jgi:hypothetical protein